MAFVRALCGWAVAAAPAAAAGDDEDGENEDDVDFNPLLFLKDGAEQIFSDYLTRICKEFEDELQALGIQLGEIGAYP